MKLFIRFCFAFFALSSSQAQEKATIVRFDFVCTVNVNYDIWDDDYTNDFIYENESKQKVTTRTVDTIFSYAQQTIARKLGIVLDKKTVSKDAKQNMIGKITGFPNEKVKDVAPTGRYGKLIEIAATVLPGPATIREKGATIKRNYQIDMIVEVKVYDKEGREIERYKKRSRMEEVKQTVEIHGVRDANDLSGNELFALFAHGFDNALDNRK